MQCFRGVCNILRSIIISHYFALFAGSASLFHITHSPPWPQPGLFPLIRVGGGVIVIVLDMVWETVGLVVLVGVPLRVGP